MKTVNGSPQRVLVVGLLGLFGVVGARTARADVASFVVLGGGAGLVSSASVAEQFDPVMRLSTGMGTDPSHPFIVGGLLRTETFFGTGTDLSLSLRTADNGFVNGDWGWAVDVGGLARYFGKNAYGVAGTLVLGAPWGLQVELGYARGTQDLKSASATLCIDLARLTVYRRTGTSWWKNTFPAVRKQNGDAERP